LQEEVKKMESILAAVHGKLIGEPIADEVVAQAILGKI
jgi:DNA-binding transcriptional regulator LsrR (DeoR family)